MHATVIDPQGRSCLVFEVKFNCHICRNCVITLDSYRIDIALHLSLTPACRKRAQRERCHNDDGEIRLSLADWNDELPDHETFPPVQYVYSYTDATISFVSRSYQTPWT